MKKFISILLIFTIVAPFWIFYSILQYEKFVTKKEVKRQLVSGIDKSELTLLKFSAADVETKLKWEHSEEFEFANEMYDVVKSKVSGDSVYYWCWKDSKETALNTRLNNLVDAALGTNKTVTDSRDRLVNFFSSLFPTTATPFDFNFNTKAKSLCFFYSTNHESVYSKPPLPPPKV